MKAIAAATHRIRFVHLCLSLLFAAGFLIGCAQEETAPPAGPGSGFTVLPEFESFYKANGGAALLGEPITGACRTADGRLLQYLQRTRLEQDVTTQGVQLYPLGEWALAGLPEQVPASVPVNSEKRTFPTTDYTVQDEFLAFYEAHNGEEILGPPVSPQLDEGELRVQYFRNGRLEWHPDAPRARRVQLGLLGQAHYLQTGAAEVRCDVLARPLEAKTIAAVDVDAAVSAPILYSGEQQLVYVTVTTPAAVPVAGVAVALTTTFNGSTFTVELGPTDEDGKVSGTVQLPQFEPGQDVDLTVLAQNAGGEMIGKTSLSFATWW